MYSLLMVGRDGYWDDGPATVEIGRYLEYTSDSLRARLEAMSDDVVAELKSMPALFAYEHPTDHPARVGWIIEIQRRQRDLRIVFRFDPAVPPIPPGQIEQLLRQLDIEPKYEVHRTHWAVKEVDIFDVLRTACQSAPNLDPLSASNNDPFSGLSR